MISLSTEMTDTKGRHAERGWICFDRDCTICTSLARRCRHTFEKHGFGLAALQDPRVAALLALPPDQLLREMRVVTTTGEIHGGAEAIVYLAKQVWWAWPFFAAAHIPGVSQILDIAYRWFADHRLCSSGACSAAKNKMSGRAAQTKGGTQ
jgi:predicted DCC family thiol-disulfide oxidoreductase YuxK